MESNAMAKNHAWVFARVAFVAVFGGVSAGLISQGWYDFWYVSAIAVTVAALIYGTVYIAYPMVVVQQPAPTAVPKPIIKPELEVEYEYEDEPEEDEEEDEEREEPVRPGQQRVEAVQDNGRFYHLGNTQFQLPEDVKPQHLNIVLGARARGRLPDITENKLNKIGISRFAMPPNARTTMEFLRKQGMIDKNGQWTLVGERYFPSPNGYNGQNGVV